MLQKINTLFDFFAKLEVTYDCTDETSQCNFKGAIGNLEVPEKDLVTNETDQENLD